MKTFVIASNNPKKVNELNRILNPMGITAKTAKEMGVSLDDVEETGTTFAENSALKARAAFKLCGCAVLADDSGLEIDALDGEPGVYSARYGGLETDDERTALVLKKMKEIPDDKRGAHFTCTIHFIKADGEEIAVEGKVFGKIAHEPVGENGFGYDPIFMYGNKSFAQVDSETKNTVSHRANALKALLEQLTKQ